MSFLSGFISGFALTTSVLFLSIQIHQANRLQQCNTIRGQARTLNYLSASVGAYDRRFTPRNPGDLPRRAEYEAPRSTEQPTTKELLKQRWNREVERVARRVNESQWEDVRGGAVEGWNAAVKFVKRE